MNTAHDQACSVSKNAVMDCKITSLDVLLLAIVFVSLDVTAASSVLQMLPP
jgi:hypothetical protein